MCNEHFLQPYYNRFFYDDSYISAYRPYYYVGIQTILPPTPSFWKFIIVDVMMISRCF